MSDSFPTMICVLVGSGDPCQRLQESGAVETLMRDRSIPSILATQDYLDSRHNAETVLGQTRICSVSIG